MGLRYRLLYLEEVIHSHIPALSSSLRNLIKQAIEERLTLNPIAFAKPLRYNLKGYRRLRVSDYRVVYRIEVKTMTVIIVAIKHPKAIY